MKKLSMLRSSFWCNIFRGTLAVISFLRLLVPELDFFYEEECMGFLTCFDFVLVPWIFVVNRLGKVMTKSKLPKWVSVPVSLLIISIIIAGLSGWLYSWMYGQSGFSVILYALGNGIFIIGFPALVGYDIVHEFLGKQWKSFKEWREARKLEKNKKVVANGNE